MTCTKCGNTTNDEESLCEQCLGEENGSIPENGAGPGKPKKMKIAVIALISVFVLLAGAVTVGKLFFNRDFMQLLQAKPNTRKTSSWQQHRKARNSSYPFWIKASAWPRAMISRKH